MIAFNDDATRAVRGRLSDRIGLNVTDRGMVMANGERRQSGERGGWTIAAMFLSLLVRLAIPLNGEGPTTSANVPAASQPSTAAPAAGDVKWHPGHYAFVQSSAVNESHLYKHFLGIQKSYDWRTLEPEKDHYDFSTIRADLAFLGKREKRLIIQVQTKAFGAGQNCCPAYLSGADYAGGLATRRGGDRSIR